MFRFIRYHEHAPSCGFSLGVLYEKVKYKHPQFGYAVPQPALSFCLQFLHWGGVFSIVKTSNLFFNRKGRRIMKSKIKK